MKTLSLEVPYLYAPKRIDAYLAEALQGEYSRQTVKKALEGGQIYLNGKAARPRDLVQEKDLISGELPDLVSSTLVGEDIPLKIVYEDDSLLVIDKARGMVVHPGAGHKKGTLVQALLGRGTALSSAGGSERPGIVHRLDRDTSGLLLVAKTNAAHKALAEQFAQRTLSKFYTALVHGRLEFEEGHIEVSIGRDPKVRQKMAVSKKEDARDALTHYKVLKRFRGMTLLELRIATGRTHQIRVHLTHLGHPVVGDTLYGKPGTRAARLMLHASKIKFTHPKTHKIMSFESPLPDLMNEAIEKAAEAESKA
jgi:23S rRNA pseudouridine1911/1915/1917 synthase